MLLLSLLPYVLYSQSFHGSQKAFFSCKFDETLKVLSRQRNPSFLEDKEMDVLPDTQDW